MIRPVLAAMLLVLMGAVQAQDAPPTLDPVAREKAVREGTHVLRRILFDEGFTARETLAEIVESPERSLLVVLGNLESLHRVPGGLRRFVEKGGAVLLASDRPIRDRESLAAFVELTGVSIAGNHLITPNFWECYQSREYCPFLLPAAGARVNLFLDPEGIPLKPVACNVPAHLISRRNNPPLGVFAVMTSSALQETADGPRPVEGWPVIVRGGPVGEGKAMVLADHSLFINEMMMPQDTGNVEFAVNMVRYLREEKRDRVLFFDEGVIQTRLDLPLQSPRLNLEELLTLLYSRKDALLGEAERWIAKQEDDDNAFNRWVVNAIDRRFGWVPFLFGVAVAVTIAVGLYAVYRLWLRNRYAPDTSTPLLVNAMAKVLPEKPLAEQRLETLLRQGDVREPLRVLARQWLLALGLTAPRSARDPLPVIQAHSWWTAWHFRSRLQRIWQLAAGQWPSRMQPRKLQEWQREMDALQEAHRQGQWRARGEG